MWLITEDPATVVTGLVSDHRTAGANGFNSLATATAPVAQGPVGSIQGTPVYVDPNVPVDESGTQDLVIVTVRDDIYRWETPVVAEILQQPYASSLSLMARLYGYQSLIVSRYPKSLGLISGTGLTTPDFPDDPIAPAA